MNRTLIHSTTAFTLLAVGVLSCPAVAQDAVAQDAVAQNTEPIVLERCPIKLVERVVLASERLGIIEFVEPEEGDEVTAGQELVGLIDDAAQARLELTAKRAESTVDLRYAKKAAEVAQIEYERALAANNEGVLAYPDGEILRRKLSAERAQLAVEQAMNQLEIAKLEQSEAEAALRLYRIVAPFDGEVTRVHKLRGEAVQQGEPIVELINTRRVRVDGYLSLQDAWRVQSGDLVTVQMDIPDVDLPVEQQSFSGKVIFVSSEVEPVANTVRVSAEVNNEDDLLKAGLKAVMTIQPSGSKLAREEGRPALSERTP